MTRILFFGTEQLAATQLDALIADTSFEIIEVVTQPPRPVGRKQIITKSAVHILAEKNSLQIFTPETLIDDVVFEHCAALSPDLIVVAQYGLIIPERILQIAPRGALNVHGSLLPQHRGASPIHGALLAGDTVTGVTFMLMDAKMDHGPMLAHYECHVLNTDTTEILMERVGALAAAHLSQTIHDYLDGKIIPEEQDHTAATFTKLLSRESGIIYPAEQDAAYIERMVRAFTPWPGVTMTLPDGELIKIISAHVVPDVITALPGTISFSANALFLATKKGTLAITSLRPGGKDTMDAASFMRGRPHLDGACVQ